MEIKRRSYLNDCDRECDHVHDVHVSGRVENDHGVSDHANVNGFLHDVHDDVDEVHGYDAIHGGDAHGEISLVKYPCIFPRLRLLDCAQLYLE